MTKSLKDQIAEASWLTSTDAGQGIALTPTQEVAALPSPSFSCCLNSTVHHLSPIEPLDSDLPSGEPGRPFSFDPGHVTSWLYRFYGSHERLGALLSVAPVMEIGHWLTVLGEEWTGFDYLAADSQELFYVLLDRRVDYESPITQMMTPEEKRAFDARPNDLTVYRGCGPRNEFGYSWTLDRKIAEKFPFMRRYHTEYPTLLTMTIRKDRAVALKLGRNEQEIILFDDPDLTEFPGEWKTKPILRDPAGNLVQSWADDPNGELIDAYLEKWHCL